MHLYNGIPIHYVKPIREPVTWRRMREHGKWRWRPSKRVRGFTDPLGGEVYIVRTDAINQLFPYYPLGMPSNRGYVLVPECAKEAFELAAARHGVVRPDGG